MRITLVHRQIIMTATLLAVIIAGIFVATCAAAGFYTLTLRMFHMHFLSTAGSALTFLAVFIAVASLAYPTLLNKYREIISKMHKKADSHQSS